MSAGSSRGELALWLPHLTLYAPHRLSRHPQSSIHLLSPRPISLDLPSFDFPALGPPSEHRLAFPRHIPA